MAGYVLPTIFRSLGIPTVVTMHEIFDDISLSAVGVRSEWTVRAGGRIATRLALNADVTCVTLARHESQLRRLYRTTNVRHIPHGSLVEPELLPHRSGHREQKLLFLGCLSPHKGLSVLLASFKRFRRRGGQARLLIVGDDHPRFSTYCGEVRAQLSDTDGVEYVGAQPEVRLRKLFSDSTAVVLPYLASTGASSVLYRAAALGRPAILSDLDELRASAEEVGLQAEYVPPNDSVALATTIERLLRDEIRMEALARHNVAIMRRYTPTEICNLYVDVFRQVLDGRSKRRIV
ncbi:MAG: glycosyltransferase [Deltaproteobacteria bacterium]|nr:glycosyltransferase [Deltaproteobacteria bacterium]